MVDALIRALYWYSSNSISNPLLYTSTSARASPLQRNSSYSALINNLVLHSTPPLHLSMELQPHPNLTLVHILPVQLTIPPLENLPVHTRARLAQNRRPPLAILDSRELHSATNWRRSRLIFTASCCCFQALRRASRGCVDDVLGAPAALGAGAERLRLWRRVSWTPGAEGAPRTAGVVCVDVVAGMMRRD
jgi:hypothetical protein